MILEAVPKIRIPYVCEHDVDMLFLEELVATPGFLEWLLAHVALAEGAELLSAACSVSTSTGESDLEIVVRSAGKTIGVLIENKLDAILQPEQAHRYQQRAGYYVNKGSCDACVTLIIAPRKYFADDEDTKKFDFRICLENIRKWFDGPDIPKARKQYIQALLDKALEKGCVGWRLVPDRTVTEFWRKYWEIADRVAPELQMPKPPDRPSGSTFVYFKPHDLPSNIQLIHKWAPGYLDLQFAGMGDRTALLQGQYKKRLGKGMAISRAARSGVIRIRVPEIGMTMPFDAAEPLIRMALKSALRLLRWYRRVNRNSMR
jgi:hypothetical protein